MQTLLRLASTPSTSKSNRRRRIVSEDQSEELQLKPLELELRETRKCLSQLQDELARTKNRLNQTVAVSEESSKEIARLMEQNEILKNNHTSLEVPVDNGEIMSIRVLTDHGVQTDPETFEIGSREDEFPIVTSQLAPPEVNDTNLEKLVEELGTATKVKVDLLKELTKVNKEAERTRHLHQDQVLKLERELESLQGDLAKNREDQLEKDTLRDRMKDDYERKLRIQGIFIAKLKQKEKDVEKVLKEKGTGDKRLQEGEREIEKLNVQIATLKKKLKDGIVDFLTNR